MGERSALEMNDGAVASLRLLSEWGIADIAERLAATTARIEAEAKALGLAISSAPARGPHLLGIELPREAAVRAFSTLARARRLRRLSRQRDPYRRPRLQQ